MRTRYATKAEAQEDGWLTLTEAKARAEEVGELATDQRPQGRETEYGYGLWLIREDGAREEVASAGVSLTEVTNAAGKRGAVLQMVRREELEAALAEEDRLADRRAADVVAVGVIIHENGITEEEAAKINREDGWTYEVIYPDVADDPGFREGRAWTRVEGRSLSREALAEAVAYAGSLGEVVRGERHYSQG